MIPGVSNVLGRNVRPGDRPVGHDLAERRRVRETLTFQDFPTFSTSIMYVNKSTDGGLTWGPPTQLVRNDSLFKFNDKNSITADPFELELRLRDLGPQPVPERQARDPFDLRVPALDPQ